MISETSQVSQFCGLQNRAFGMEEASTVPPVPVVRRSIPGTCSVSSRYGRFSSRMCRVDAEGTKRILRKVESRVSKGLSHGTNPEDFRDWRVDCQLLCFVFLILAHVDLLHSSYLYAHSSVSQSHDSPLTLKSPFVTRPFFSNNRDCRSSFSLSLILSSI